MFTRLNNSWQLFNQCLAILRSDKKLTLFPLLSGLACLIVVASFALPVGLYIAGKTDVELNNPTPAEQLAGWVLLFVFYLVNYFVVVFFNSALASCVIARFKGVEATMMDGLSMASARLPQIFGWAVLSATVGTILRAIEDRLGWLGSFVVGLLGAAWAVATYLVVPTLVVEGVGPLEATRRSVALVTKCWGEGLAGHIGLSAISTLAMFLIIIITVLLSILALATGSVIPLLVVLGFALVSFLILGIVMSTLGQIYISGLYLFAAEGKIPEGLSESLLRDAFKPKK